MFSTPPKTKKIEHKNEGLENEGLLFNWVIFRFQPLVFQGKNPNHQR